MMLRKQRNMYHARDSFVCVFIRSLLGKKTGAASRSPIFLTAPVERGSPVYRIQAPVAFCRNHLQRHTRSPMIRGVTGGKADPQPTNQAITLRHPVITQIVNLSSRQQFPPHCYLELPPGVCCGQAALQVALSAI
jgi:hypothetical protein